MVNTIGGGPGAAAARYRQATALAVTKDGLHSRLDAGRGRPEEVVDAYKQLATLATPVQIGGAGATLAAATELASLLGNPGNPAKVSAHLARPPQPPLACTLQRPGIPPERQ